MKGHHERPRRQLFAHQLYRPCHQAKREELILEALAVSACVLDLAFRRDPDGDLLYRQVVLSERKKSGKTFIAASIAIW